MAAFAGTLLAAACTTTSGRTGTSADLARPPSAAVARTTAATAVPMLPTGGPGDPVAASTTITCGHAIDGDPPPGDLPVVLGAVALPAGPSAPALLAVDAGPDAAPRLFAKNGLVIRAGRQAELTVPEVPGNRVGIGWSGWPSRPGQRVVVPACPDTWGTGWLAFAGGYWADIPLCLPVTVRSGGAEQQVPVGVGTSCPGQSPAPLA